MTVELRPSFIRCVAWITPAMVALSVVTYFWQGYHENHWWARDYMLTLLIPLTLAPIVVWFAFVPPRLEFTDRDLTIQFWFRTLYTLDWADLKYYGHGNAVFMIQFDGVATFQIFTQAFRRSEWCMLKNFLSTTFPERQASSYIGTRMFRWPWEKPNQSAKLGQKDH